MLVMTGVIVDELRAKLYGVVARVLHRALQSCLPNLG